MTTSIEKKNVFSPGACSERELVLSYLLHRFSTLPKEALADLASLGPELADCKSEAEFKEIAATIREIVFPELIGSIRAGSFGSESSENLNKYASLVGKNIKQARERASLTQAQLAERTGLPQSHISRLECGAHSPSNRTLARIADALSIELRELGID